MTTMKTKTAELTNKMISSVTTKMVAGSTYTDAFAAAVSELSDLVAYVCSGGKNASARMASLAGDVFTATH